MKVTDRKQKIVKRGRWLIGGTGHGSALAMVFRKRALDDCKTPQELAEAIHATLRNAGWKSKAGEGGGPEVYPTWWLLASPAGAWVVYGDADPEELTELFGLGSGGELAEGAARALIQSSGMPIAEALARAVQIACERDIHSGGEISVLFTEALPC
jgi:ATP-dependent protease HslVU (ClpYQ) peptidase subunit